MKKLEQLSLLSFVSIVKRHFALNEKYYHNIHSQNLH